MNDTLRLTNPEDIAAATPESEVLRLEEWVAECKQELEVASKSHMTALPPRLPTTLTGYEQKLAKAEAAYAEAVENTEPNE